MAAFAPAAAPTLNINNQLAAGAHPFRALSNLAARLPLDLALSCTSGVAEVKWISNLTGEQTLGNKSFWVGRIRLLATSLGSLCACVRACVCALCTPDLSGAGELAEPI